MLRGRVFQGSKSTAEIYEEMGEERFCLAALQGLAVSILMYGPTGEPLSAKGCLRLCYRWRHDAA